MTKRAKGGAQPDLLGTIEQLVLSAVIGLGDEAYGVSVFDALRAVAYSSIAFGSVYTTLERLTWKGYLEGFMGESIPERGGRARKYFRVTALGKKVLESTEETLRRARLIDASVLP